MDRVQAHVARLMRSILLRPSAEDKMPAAQFFAGRGKPFTFSGGIGLTWWYSPDTFNAIDTVTALIIETEQEFKDCDTESVDNIVTSTLQKVCLDSPLFNGDDVAFGRKPNLFECRGAVSVTDFTKTILEEIKQNLRSVIGKRCTIYPLPRFKGPSLSLPEEGLHLISCSDDVAWNNFSAGGYIFDSWTPSSPFTANSNFSFNGGYGFNYVLIGEDYGTQKGAKFASSLKFRMFITVLFAHASELSKYGYNKSMAQPYTNCIQFPHKTTPDNLLTLSDCGALSPFYASDIIITDNLTKKVTEWYESLNKCPTDYKQRIKKSVNFFNRAMNSEDIESYINYFIALDALFGQRGSVEASIIAGVGNLGLDEKLKEKASWLFDLRNELVHGGSRYISEWPKHQRYTKHFGSKPLNDLKELAQNAILKAPSILPISTVGETPEQP
ncbi:HEPN domain-containing protein [Pseudomonas poae]|uniref:HEPN domain-containing protein n=1 Tax=Pseudomonas poae TaxID=200451 RepID=UPI000348572C|nr:HEPN domain-containing protein [Pseudomonas poae]